MTDGVRAIAGLGTPDLDVARRIVGLVRAVGANSSSTRGSSRRRSSSGGSPARRSIARSPANAARAPAEVPGAGSRSSPRSSARGGCGSQAVPVSPGIGAGRSPSAQPSSARSTAPVPATCSSRRSRCPTWRRCSGTARHSSRAGGTSGAHLFEVARSLGVPAVIGPEIGRRRYAAESGSLVAVDGDTGRRLDPPGACCLDLGVHLRHHEGRAVCSRRGGPGGGARWRSSR